MRKYEMRKWRMGMVRTVVGCMGWSILGYTLMQEENGPFWIGWVLFVVEVLIGVNALCSLVESW